MNTNTMFNQSRLAVILRSLESVLVGCSDANPNDVVLGDNITYSELSEVYEELCEGYTRIIRNPMDKDDMSLFVEHVADLVIVDAETQYDSTTWPGEVSDQIDREEAIAKYTTMQEILESLIEDLELDVRGGTLSSVALDTILQG
jgi:hypothetical protein